VPLTCVIKILLKIYSSLIVVSFLIIYKNTTKVHTQNRDYPLNVIDIWKKVILKIESMFTFSKWERALQI